MTKINIRLHGNDFRDIVDGKKTEVAKYASDMRICYLCSTKKTKGCIGTLSKCRECFNNAKLHGGYECYQYDTAVLRKGQTDNYITREIESIHWEERNGKTWFVFKLKNDDAK